MYGGLGRAVQGERCSWIFAVHEQWDSDLGALPGTINLLYFKMTK